MYDNAQDIEDEPAAASEPGEFTQVARHSENDKELVKKLVARIRADKHHHRDAFKQMREDMEWAKYGADKNWRAGQNYVANIVGRHVRAKTANLYAKNPRFVAKRKDTLDFAVWDETQESLQLAFSTIQAAMLVAQQGSAINMDGSVAPPQLPPGFEQARAVIEDFQQGMQRRIQTKKIGRTLETLFAQALLAQQPNDFKRAMKKVVRRACTTGVGYVELAYQREMGPRPDVQNRLDDARRRVSHLELLAAKQGEEDGGAECRAEKAELELMIEQLLAEPEQVIQEGLVIDYPQATTIIPDKDCTELMGFVGAKHLTREFKCTKGQVRKEFGVDLGTKYTPYRANGEKAEAGVDYGDEEDGQGNLFRKDQSDSDIVCVWKHWDKDAGLVYFLCEGYDGYLREPAAPDVFVNDFWPVYALTFNDVEHEKELFPPSDVFLLRDPQREYNKQRQGLREHRQAARPRFVAAKGIIEEEDQKMLEGLQAFETAFLNIDAQSDINKVLQPIKMPGVDPNLYETGQVFSDMQLVAGTQEAQLGGVSKATATESAIAESSSASSDGASVDDLDGFMTKIVRGAGQILLGEMAVETVHRIVGIGAVWPDDLSRDAIAEELYLDIEAGSSGKPNQATEINNWSKMLPFLLQMPNMNPTWVARETLRRLDDKADLTEALVEGMYSIMAQNQMSQPAAADPAASPDQQGGKGKDNAPRDEGKQAGSGPAFGSNQV